MNQLMKNFEKRFTFAKVIKKHQVAYFYKDTVHKLSNITDD